MNISLGADYRERESGCCDDHTIFENHKMLLELTAGTNKMALKVTSPSAVKWIFANGSAESLLNNL